MVSAEGAESFSSLKKAQNITAFRPGSGRSEVNATVVLGFGAAVVVFTGDCWQEGNCRVAGDSPGIEEIGRSSTEGAVAFRPLKIALQFKRL
jgi:hypothetical protein